MRACRIHDGGGILESSDDIADFMTAYPRDVASGAQADKKCASSSDGE
jgi:hypothetical protein